MCITRNIMNSMELGIQKVNVKEAVVILSPSVVDRTALRSRFSMQIHSNAAKILMLLEKINNVETLIKSKKSKKNLENSKISKFCCQQCQ